MTERPILFDSWSVTGILDGSITQTRRVVKPQPTMADGPYLQDGYPGEWGWMGEDTSRELPFETRRCPYGVPGDQLWGREAFAFECNDGLQDIYENPDNPLGPVRRIEPLNFDGDTYFECPRYRASEPDCILGDDEDGMKWKPSIHMPRWASRIQIEITDVRVERVQDGEQYRELWDEHHAKKGFGWDVNPWCWVVEFKLVTP